MRYVLARECNHEDHGEECPNLAYLQEGTEEDKSVKVFESKEHALDFMKDNRYSPRTVMVIPYEEGIYE
tara:strand:- start:419 stop:625 length:207 start_codon:yes stop_codon:yes gene_type:complete